MGKLRPWRRALGDGKAGVEVVGARGPVRLSAQEHAVYRRLVAAGGAAVPRTELGDEGRRVDFAVRRLRRKLERDPGAPRLILTVHGVGYRWGTTKSPPRPVPPRALLELRDRKVDLGLGLVLRLGDERPLTTLQLALLRVLVEARGAIVPRDQLARAVWGHARGAGVERVVHELRKRLEAEPSHPVHLVTRKPGYRWAAEPRKTNLARPEALVGRTDELAFLTRGRQPWTLIVGMPGIGKSHLARHLCLRLSETLAGGAWWVDASACRSPDSLLQATATTLGLGQRVRPGAVRLEVERRPQLALVLDDVCADAQVGRLARELVSGGARVFATTTQAIDAPRVLALQGLPPADGRALYLSGVPAGTEPVPEADVDALVRQVEGHPLALSLASRRARAVPPSALWTRTDGFTLLSRHRSTDAHSSVRAAFDHALASTHARQRRALRHCVAFRAPFTADAARAVAGVEPTTLDALVDRSLLQREGADPPVYRLHSLIRAWLDTSTLPAEVHERKTRWFVERAAVLLECPEGRMRAELDRTLPDLVEVATQLATTAPPAAVGIVALLRACGWLPRQLHRGLVDKLLSDGARFEGSGLLHRFRVSYEVGDGRLDAARAALEEARAHGLDPDSWPYREANILVATVAGDEDGLDPGPEAPKDPRDRWNWAARRGRFLTDRALLDGQIEPALALLRASARDAERSKAAMSAALIRSWVAHALALAGASAEQCATRLEDAMLALEAMGHRSHAANVAWRLANVRADMGARARARALIERYPDQRAQHRMLEFRGRLVLLRIRIDEADPDVLVAESLELCADTDSAGDLHGLHFARLLLALARGRTGAPGALQSLDDIHEGHWLPVVAGAVAACLDPARQLPRPLPVRHWVNDAVALARATRNGATFDPGPHTILRAMAQVAGAHGHACPSATKTRPQSVGNPSAAQ